jgi:hypothetical protein
VVNEQRDTRDDEVAAGRARIPAPPAPPPLVILAADEDAACVDDLCLPADVHE